MAGRPFKVHWHDKDTSEALRAAYRAERDVALRSRLHALWLLRNGHSICQVAVVLGVHYNTVQKWMRWYKRGGLNEVVSHHQGGLGRESYLNDEEMLRLAREVESGRFPTATDVRDWIEAECGIEYSLQGVYSLLKRIK